MNVAVALLTLLLLAVVILVISAPLRRRARRDRSEPEERSELEAARLAKYREIRDTELDYRTGKLSRQDYEPLVATLRAQGVKLRRCAVGVRHQRQIMLHPSLVRGDQRWRILNRGIGASQMCDPRLSCHRSISRSAGQRRRVRVKQPGVAKIGPQRGRYRIA